MPLTIACLNEGCDGQISLPPDPKEFPVKVTCVLCNMHHEFTEEEYDEIAGTAGNE